MNKSWGIIVASCAVLVPVFLLNTGCQSEQPLSAKTPDTKNKFLGSGPSPEEQAKMRELQAQVMKNSGGPSAAQLEAMKKRRPAKP